MSARKKSVKEQPANRPACPDCGKPMLLTSTGVTVRTFRCPACRAKTLAYIEEAEPEREEEEA